MEGVIAYGHAPEYHVTFGRGNLKLFDKIPYRPHNVLRDDFKCFLTYHCPKSLLESRVALRIKKNHHERSNPWQNHKDVNMRYCYSGTERLCHWNWHRHMCRKGKFKADHPTWSIWANPSRKQKCCSSSCLWSQVQWDTSGPDNYRNLNYLWTICHWCICMWSGTGILFISGREQKTAWFPLLVSTEICWLVEGHNWGPLECRLSVEKKSFPRRPRKVSNWNSCTLIMSSSGYLLFESEFYVTKYWFFATLNQIFDFLWHL